MAAASESQAGAAPLPTPAAMRSWSIAEVAKWALTIRSIDADDTAVLTKNKITGEDLLDRVTKEELERWGMPGGPAGRIMSALAAVKSLEAAVPASMDRKRARYIDGSASYALNLAASLPASIDAVADLRREIEAPLPPIIVSSFHLTLLTKGGAVMSFEEHDDRSSLIMEEIEQLFVSAWLRPVLGGTEEVWATTADALTGGVLAVLDRLTSALAMTANRNAVDPSGTTDTGLRPDYWLLVRGALLLKAEHKRTAAELAIAKGELVSKMKCWNAVSLSGLAFLPCFAIGGELLQFCAVVRTAGGDLVVEDVSPVFNMTVDLDRLRIVRATCNMFRVLVALRRRMPANVPALYSKQGRADGTSITIMDDHVLKECWPAPDGVYACLEGEGAIPCAIRVISRYSPPGGDGLTHIKMAPVCVEAIPDSEADLQRAVRCVLRALGALHARGFVHRDVRWPNVLHDLSDGGALLADFELAAPAGEQLPERYRGPASLPPEARGGGAYGPAGDVWQVGQLVGAWAHPRGAMPRGLSLAGAAFALRLTAELPALRPTVDAVLAGDEWLRYPQ